MPSAVTHAYFARDVYKKLPAKVKRKIDLDEMVTFSQGPDVFYYDLLREKNRNFGKLVHTTKTEKFIIEYVDHILKYRLEKKKEVISSLYGMVLHYVLDKTTHPFIYYETDGSPVKHREMELLIDLYMIEKREKINPRKVDITTLVFPKMAPKNQLQNLLDRVYEDVYGVSNMGKVYLRNLPEMKEYFHMFRYDPYGYKLKLYRVIHKLPFVSNKICYNSYAIDLRTKVAYINFEHEVWCHPCNKSETSTKSFFDLYHDALEEAVFILTQIHQVLVKENEVRSLQKVTGNKSMITGKDCNSKTKMTYFKNKKPGK